MPQNLYFNLIEFDWPKAPITMYFSLSESQYSKRIHKSAFPENIESIFPAIKSDNTEFIYTTFTQKLDKTHALQINISNVNQEFAKYYYRDMLRYYFKKIRKHIVRYGFIDEVEVYIKSKTSTKQFTVFEVFSLQIQIREAHSRPSILISYEGKTKILNESLPKILETTSPTLISKVLYNNHIHKYEQLVKQKDVDFKECYPVVGNRLARHLGIEIYNPNDEKNRYKRYYNQIVTFYKHFCAKDDFKKFFPGTSGDFIKVPTATIGEIKIESNNLVYGKDGAGNYRIGTTPKTDFKKLRPAENTPYKNVHIFFIYHVDDEANKTLLEKYLKTGIRHYKGLYDYTSILNHIDNDASIAFTNKENPIPELETKWSTFNYDTQNIKYLAIYLTPFSKAETKKQVSKAYVRVKEFLLKRRIVCQSLEPHRIAGEDFVFSLTTMSVAILAKLEGIPWRLQAEPTKELVVGVGAFKNPADGVKYLSSAFSFDNTGRFNSFAYFMENETKELAGNIAAKVKEFAMINGLPSRLIIHFYKKLSQKELEPIERELQRLDFPTPIPIFIVSINKTESTDIVAFDRASNELMPYSGTYINIGNKKYLLFNNARSASGFNKFDGYHFPIKLSIDCNQKQLLEDVKIIHDLINQVYQFSRMYWKSLSQQNLPVTIKYPEMVAEIVPFFSGVEIPPYGTDKLWFL